MKNEINAAILAHGQWKTRVAAVIESGQSEFTPDKVMVDNLCAFGKWFHGLIGADTYSENYKEIRDLHATFHKATAHVLELALGRWKNSVAE